MAFLERLNRNAVRIAEGKTTRKPPYVEDINAFTTDVLIATQAREARQARKPLAVIKQSVTHILRPT